jgi:uncharacterized membrane protein
VAEQTKGDIKINASAEAIMDVLLDFEAYPKWTDFKSAKVLKKDKQGRATEVAYELKAPMIGDVKMTLAYKFKASNGGLSWTTKEIEGGITDITGEYTLDELDDEETKVTYSASTELKMKVPGFIKKQGEKQVVKQALDGLKKRVEKG